MYDFNRLKCPICRRFYKNNSPVVLDILNTVLHIKCYTSYNFIIKDRGTYRSIIEKYDFFEEMRIFND